MNILFLINFAGRGGSEKYVDNLQRIFTANGQNCFFAYGVPGQLSETMEQRGVPALQLGMERAEASAAAKKLADYCRENRIDVIHAQYPRENIIALKAKKIYDVKVVYTSHLTIKPSLKWKLLNRRYTPKNHRIIAVCRQGAELLRENGADPSKIQVIYNGIEPAQSRPEKDEAVLRELGVPEGAFVMSILARYAPEKGLAFLLDSLALLKGMTDRPFACIICGEGELYEEIGERIKSLGLSGCVIQAGFRRDSDRILSASDLYLNSSPYNEAMSFAIIEAMNKALPVVATDVGGNRDLAETGRVCGRIVDYGDAEGFAKAVKAFMDDEEYRYRMGGEALLKIKEQFNLNKLAMDVLDSYR